MYVQLHYGSYEGKIRDMQFDAAAALVRAGRATRAELIDGEWQVPKESKSESSPQPDASKDKKRK